LDDDLSRPEDYVFPNDDHIFEELMGPQPPPTNHYLTLLDDGDDNAVQSRSPAPSHAGIGVRRHLQRSLLIFVAFVLIPL